MKSKRAMEKKANIAVTGVDIEMCRILSDYNLIVDYPLSDERIEDWSASIKKHAPDITHEILEWIMSMIVTGRYRINPRLGILNIYDCFLIYLDKELEKAKDDREKYIEIMKIKRKYEQIN